MISVAIENTFDGWRSAARCLLQNKIVPGEILWVDKSQNNLFENPTPVPDTEKVITVPPNFISLAGAVACYNDWTKWPLLYGLLYRLTYENKELLRIASDDDVRRARMMERAVARDVHKFHAFVRFRRVTAGEDEAYIAWHDPHHLTVERAAPFFARRFGAMRFSILTPKGCAHWDLENLTFSPGVTREFAPRYDETEEFWLAYYKSIFNPFRLKIKAMKAELPVSHWRTLPEAVLIPGLIKEAENAERPGTAGILACNERNARKTSNFQKR